MALLYLRHILFDMLPSPEMKVQGQLLSISNHLKMIQDSLWAINAILIDGELQVHYMELLKKKEEVELEEKLESKESEKKSELTEKPMLVEKPELVDWVKDVDLAIVDVEDLLSRILHWKPRIVEAAINCSFHHSFLDDDEQVLFRRSILIELRELTSKLNYLWRRGSALGIHREILDSMHPLQEEYSDILRDEVVGRDKDKDNLINLLKQQQTIIVIEGHPREKTILARMIYHDPWVSENFEYHIWIRDLVYYSIAPDSTDLAKEIVRSIKGQESLQMKNANWSTVKDLINKRRYLLVLDTYFTTSTWKNQWLELKETLLHLGAPGSAVIITMSLDAEFDDEEGITKYRMCDKISEGAWEELLEKQGVITRHQQMIRPTDTEEEHHAHAIIPLNYEDGNPMTEARVAGAIVRCTKMYRWNDSGTLSLDFSLNDLLLEMSRDNVQSYIYNSLFPINSRPSVMDVQYMFHAEGFLLSITYLLDRHAVPQQKHSTSTIALMKRKQWSFQLRMGEDVRIPQQCLYLSLLLDSHPFGLLFRRRLLAGINEKLRALVLLHEEQEEDGIFLKDQIYGITKDVFKKLKCLRILYIHNIRFKQIPNTLGRLRCLRYLKLFKMEIITLPESLCNLHNLKILSLDYCEKLQKLPKHIDKLVNLCSLNIIYCTRLQKLPESISRLINLEELCIQGCHWLIKLPKSLEDIKKLRVLDIDECTSLTRMPLNIRQMIDLEVLLGLVAAYNDVDGLGIRCMILELQELSNLRMLHLRNLERVSKQEKNIRMVNLQDKRKLQELSLHWECWNMDEDLDDVASLQVMEALKPNPRHLRYLYIISYLGQDFPSWMKLQVGVPTTYLLNYLLVIKLINIKRCKRLPPLGHLPMLEAIEISGMDLVTVIDDSFYGDNGTFPSLKDLTLCEMPILEEWQAVERESEVLPHLHQLTLIQCPKFKGFYAHTSIHSLRILLNNEILWTSNSFHWHNFSSVTELMIVGCHELRFLPQAMQQLKQLRALAIHSCNNLKALPDWLLRFEHLQGLYISGCELLSFIPQGIKYRVKMEGCPKLRL